MASRSEADRDQAIADEAKRLQPFCSRCSARKRLHAHHVVPFGDGGADTLDNLSVLCCQCHDEWHRTLEGRVPYDAFLTTIPGHRAAAIFMIADQQNRTLAELLAAHQLVVALLRDDAFYAALVDPPAPGRVERQRRGIVKARAAGVYRGRQTSIDETSVQALKAEGLGATEIAKQLGIGRASVYRKLSQVALVPQAPE